eukprot:3741583-Lingulodinium_polyedra.AAC.1
MLQALARRHEETAEPARTKVAKQVMEKASELAAFVAAIMEEVDRSFPGVPKGELRTGFVEPFLDGDANITL